MLSPLNGQLGWTNYHSLASVATDAEGVDVRDTPQQGVQQASGLLTGFDVTQPWTLTMNVKVEGIGDAGGVITMCIGDGFSAAAASWAMTFAPGDFAADKISSLAISDAVTTDSDVDVPFTSGAWHEVKLIYDGSDLVLKIAGATVLTIVGADFTGVSNLIAFFGQSGDATTSINLDAMLLTQP